MSGIEDLDELILKCRDQNARDYISEAVGSYRAGSYRSAIVATWIAVCFDLIGKLRELALAGDTEAENSVRQLDEINRTAELQRGLRFEKEILDVAFKMEMISTIEKVDLLRLQEDRNRCAHPSLNSEGERYAPPAELARLHIHSAVNHILMHEPAQGKFALKRLYLQIKSDYFPKGYEETLNIFIHGPLRKARPSLPRNLTILLLKDVFSDLLRYPHNVKAINSLNAICALHHEQFTTAMVGHLSKQVENILDSDLHRILYPICKIQNSWRALDFTQRDRISRYAEDLPSIHMDEINELLDFPHLRQAATRRVKRATLEDIDGSYFFGMHTDLMDRLIEIMLYSKSTLAANKSIHNIMVYQADLTEAQILRIVSGINENAYIENSAELENLVICLRNSKAITYELLEDALEKANLGHVTEIPF